MMPADHNVITNCDTTFFFFFTFYWKYPALWVLQTSFLFKCNILCHQQTLPHFPFYSYSSIVSKFCISTIGLWWRNLSVPLSSKAWLVCCVMYVALYCSALLLLRSYRFISGPFWLQAKEMYKPHVIPVYFEIRGKDPCLSKLRSKEFRKDEPWLCSRKHGPSQIKCLSWTSPPWGKDERSTEQTACDTTEFQMNPTGQSLPPQIVCVCAYVVMVDVIKQ